MTDQHMQIRLCKHGRAWCGECYESARGRVSRAPRRINTWLRDKGGLSMSEFLRRRTPAEHESSGERRPATCELAKRWPALFEFLVDTAWEDGASRETGTMLVCCDGGLCKAWLNDRETGDTTWLSAGTLLGLLDAVEVALRDPETEWRARPKPRRR